MDWNEFMAYQVYGRFETKERAQELWDQGPQIEIDGVPRVRVEKPPETLTQKGLAHEAGVRQDDVDEAAVLGAVQDATKRVKGVHDFAQHAVADLGALGINVASTSGPGASAAAAAATKQDKPGDKAVNVEAATLAEVRTFKVKIEVIPGNVQKLFSFPWA